MSVVKQEQEANDTKDEVSTSDASQVKEQAKEEVKAPSEKKPASQVKYVTTGALYKTVIIVSLLTSALTMFAYDYFYAIRIASFDMINHNNKLKKDLAEAVASGLLPMEQALAITMQDSDQIKAFLDAMPKNVLVLSSDVVLTNPKRVAAFGDMYTSILKGGAHAVVGPAKK